MARTPGIIIATALAALAPAALAQTPLGTSFTYMGRLSEGGVPANGTYDIQFGLFDAPALGVQLGAMVCHDNVTIAGGLFTVSLDFGAQFEGSVRWLEIRVRADTTPGNCAGGSYTTLAPRDRIGSTPNALFSLAPWASAGGDVFFKGGSVGIGTSTPSNRLTVSNENDNASIIAIDSGATAPQSSALRLNDRGIPFWSVNKNANNKFAIREVGPGEDRLCIELGGNVGIGTNDPWYRLHVIGNGPYAVVGEVTGSATGIRGSAGGSGVGVFGEAGNQGSGVVGFAPATGWAMVAAGRFGATGTKSFHIDHPLDPAGHYLNHYSAEGPEPLNMYTGNIVLGPTGQAVVRLPDYFSSINRDCRYQLTCIGGYAPVYIEQEITGNQFVIGGGRPGLKVSWRVDATRNDAWVRAYGAPVEEAKPAARQGTYLTPELFGRPPEEGEYATVRREK